MSKLIDLDRLSTFLGKVRDEIPVKLSDLTDLTLTGKDNRKFEINMTNEGTNMDLRWNWDNGDGAGAFFRSSSSDGAFGIQARNSDGEPILMGYPNGTLTWNNKNIVNEADTSGTGDFLTGVSQSGGKLTFSKGGGIYNYGDTSVMSIEKSSLNKTWIFPLVNDSAFLLKKGGSVTITKNGTDITSSINVANLFNDTTDYMNISVISTDTVVVEVTLPEAKTWTQHVLVGMSWYQFVAKAIKIETSNTTYDNGVYTEKYNVTNNEKEVIYTEIYHSPTGQDASKGFDKIRFTFTDFKYTTFRISKIVIGVDEGIYGTLVSRGGSEMFGNLTPATNNGANLGTSSKNWNEVHGTYLHTSYINDTPVLKAINHYGVCSTAAATAAKTVTVEGDFALQEGVAVKIRFSNINSASNPTLNVNSTGAKEVVFGGNIISDTFRDNLCDICTFIYDGSHWILQNSKDQTVVQLNSVNASSGVNADLRLLSDRWGSDNWECAEVRKLGTLTFNPSTGNLSVPKINGEAVAMYRSEKRNTATSGTVTLNPNEFTSITPSANVTIALGAFSDSANYICGYHCIVNNSGNKTVTLPSGVTWMNGTPTIESGTVIEMHFLRDNSTVYGAWADPSKVGGGGGDTNVIETVKVNGTALVPDSNKAVNVVVPAAGDTNVIETVKVNGTALTPDANKAVDIKGIITRTDVTGTSVTQALTPNVFYSFGTMTSLTVTLGSVVSSVNNVYSFEFTSGSTATTLTLPNNIVWQDTVTIEANTHYEISIKYAPQVSAYYGMISSWYIL